MEIARCPPIQRHIVIGQRLRVGTDCGLEALPVIREKGPAYGKACQEAILIFGFGKNDILRAVNVHKPPYKSWPSTSGCIVKRFEYPSSGGALRIGTNTWK